MREEFARTELMLGAQAMEKLYHARVIVLASAVSAVMPLRRLPAAASELLILSMMTACVQAISIVRLLP